MTGLRLHMNNLDEDEKRFHEAYLSTTNQLKRKREKYESAKTDRSQSAQEHETAKQMADSAAATKTRRLAEARDLIEIMDKLPQDKLHESGALFKEFFTSQATGLREKANSDQDQIVSLREQERQHMERSNRAAAECVELEEEMDYMTKELDQVRNRLEEIEEKRILRREERRKLDASL